MAQIIPQPEVITQYPGVTTLQPAVVTSQPIAVNPFYQYKDGWRVGFCNCCSDVAQCEISIPLTIDYSLLRYIL